MLLNPLTPDQINERFAAVDLVEEAKASGMTAATAKKAAKFVADTPEFASLLLRLFTITNPVSIEVPLAVES